MFDITMLRHAESEGNLSLIILGKNNSPLFHFGNNGYAQFRHHPVSHPWALISSISQIQLTQSQGVYSWQSD